VQSEWLALASRQGLLYAEQLTPSGNGNGIADRAGQVVALVLGGRAADLGPVRPEPVDVHDHDLDAVQRDAVARALHVSDLFLLQGFAGTGKSRVVAELVAQAADRGQRVLLVAPTAPAIDRVLERVAAGGRVCAVRCLGRDEQPDTLPPASRALTLAAQARRLREEAVPAARRDVEAREERCRRHRHDEPLLARVQHLAEQSAPLVARHEALERRRAEIPSEVEAAAAETGPTPADDFGQGLHDCARGLDDVRAGLASSLTELQKNRAQQQQELDELVIRLASVRPLAEAKDRGRWWSPAWWRALFQPGIVAARDELDARQRQVQDTITDLDRQAEQCEQERRSAEHRFVDERSRLVAAEVSRRQAQVEAEEASVRQQIDALTAEWQALCERFEIGTLRPGEVTPEAARAVRDRWLRQRQHDDEALAFARDWAACLAQSAQSFGQRLPEYVNLVAATTAALAADPLFGDASTHGSGFDLLVLEEAEAVTEPEFLALARRARRWVLVGEPAGPFSRPVPDDGRARAAVRAATVPFFHRLWEQLHCDPRRLPYAWARQQDRLCCTLWPVSPEQRTGLEVERLVDFPDVELRILNLPGVSPRLAEVAFPASMSIAAAKEYLYRELQEVPVCASSPCLTWVEEPERLVLQLADVPQANTLPVHLDAGVRELVGVAEVSSREASAASWETCAVEFDRRLGWQRRQAEDWVRNRLALNDLGRTASLRTPYRMQADLAAFVGEIFFPSAYRQAGRTASRDGPPATEGASRSVVEFLPVPPVPSARAQPGPRGPGGPNGNHRPRGPAKGGAGLELDPADVRQRERLPSALSAGLPGSGRVNYLEAQAAVGVVQSLLADRSLASQARDALPPNDPIIAVLAPYAAQAELIRRLLAQAPGVASSALRVEVGVPADFRQRECLVAVVSLTRSHTHRAVAFGDDPRLLTLALTRARHKIILLGDVGTLLRRVQWQGPLEHLDEAAAQRERELLVGLARCLEGEGPTPAAFRLREGGGP
jgi:hypothetical protein